MTESGGVYTIQDQFTDLATYTQSQAYDITLHFKYMIGDRTGTVHVGPEQEMDLERSEIDLPFNAYVYNDGHLGLAPDTYVHGKNLWEIMYTRTEVEACKNGLWIFKLIEHA